MAAAKATISSVVKTQRVHISEVTALLALDTGTYSSGGVSCSMSNFDVNAAMSVVFGTIEPSGDTVQTYCFEYDYTNEMIKVFMWVPGADTFIKLEYDVWCAEQVPPVSPANLPAGLTGITVRVIGAHDF